MNDGFSIIIDKVSKSFSGTVAVDELELKIPKGIIFGILGPNGAGKTTTIKLICGLLRPDKGSLLVLGGNLFENPVEIKKKIAVLPDVPYIYEKLTGWEFMYFISRIYDLDTAGLDGRIDRELEIFNIKGVAHELVDSYSHGMRQRLLMASVMLRDPELLILDEPMVGLDPEAARLVKDMFKRFSSRGRTVFLSTHTLADAEELCDDIAIINKGKLIARGNISSLRSDLKSASSASSLESIYLSYVRENA